MSNLLKTTTIIVSLIFCCLSTASAQEKYAKAYEKKGDAAFERGYYEDALECYSLGRRFVLKPLSLFYKSGEAIKNF